METDSSLAKEDGTEGARGDARSLDNPWLIIGLLFFAVGALGIPAIWMSRAFSRRAKIGLTVAVSLYTAACLVGFCFLLVWFYRHALRTIG